MSSPAHAQPDLLPVWVPLEAFAVLGPTHIRWMLRHADPFVLMRVYREVAHADGYRDRVAAYDALMDAYDEQQRNWEALHGL